MKTALLIVNLVQAIGLLLAAGIFYIGKEEPSDVYKSFMERLEEYWRKTAGTVGTVGKDVTQELDELKEEASDVYNNIGDGVAEYWREIVGGVFAVLFTLMIIRGLLIVALRKKTGTSSARHLLDMTVEERWRYIEDKDEGDLEEQMADDDYM